MAVTVLVSYDIADDGRRSRTAALLQAYGDRIQKSVFILIVNQDELNEIKSRIAGLIRNRADSVYLFELCANCWQAKTCLGQASPPVPQLVYLAL